MELDVKNSEFYHKFLLGQNLNDSSVLNVGFFHKANHEVELYFNEAGQFESN